MAGPLAGYRIVELAGLGPAPFCAMLLADLGATVIRVERKGAIEKIPLASNVSQRGRTRIALDLKQPYSVALVRGLIDDADGLVEGFRPGVAERLGLGPEVCCEANSRLVYVRITGWGQDGPLANAAGHDLNYIAIAGALHHIGRAGQPPTAPINLLGDNAGGGLFGALGLVSALLEARSSGLGQIVDVAMVDGVACLMAQQYGMQHAGLVGDERGTNLLDGGAYFYDTYACADGRYLAVAPIEPQFHAEFLALLGVPDRELWMQHDRAGWEAARARLASIFLTRTRSEWCEILEGTDACCGPVLSMGEAPHHEHVRARKTIVDVDGVPQPAPAPRFSRSHLDAPIAPKQIGEDLEAALNEWGWATHRITDFCDRIGALHAAAGL
jgi:alpha-methylacyl-CoA racemase